MKKEEMDHFKILMKLIGTVTPYGASHIDPERFENLKNLCYVTDQITLILQEVSQYKERHEHSMKEIGEYAFNFLQSIKEPEEKCPNCESDNISSIELKHSKCKDCKEKWTN